MMKNNNSAYSKQVGKTTFIVCVKQAETAEKSLEKAFCDLCRLDAAGGLQFTVSSGLYSVLERSNSGYNSQTQTLFHGALDTSLLRT